MAATERWKIVKPITMQVLFFTQVSGSRSSLCKKRYKGFSINRCSVDISAIKTTNSFENTYNECGAGPQHRSSAMKLVVSFPNTSNTGEC